MIAPVKLQPDLDRSFCWLSTCNAAVRANLLPSSQIVQSPSFDADNGVHFPSITHRSTLDPNARSHSPHSVGSVAATKPP